MKSRLLPLLSIGLCLSLIACSKKEDTPVATNSDSLLNISFSVNNDDPYEMFMEETYRGSNKDLKRLRKEYRKLTAEKAKIKSQITKAVERTQQTSAINAAPRLDLPQLRRRLVDVKERIQATKDEMESLPSNNTDEAKTVNKRMLSIIDQKNKLFSRFKNKQVILLNEIVEVLAQEHLLVDEKSKYRTQSLANNLLDDIAESSKKSAKGDLTSFKAQYEKYIEKVYLNNGSLQYNAAYATLNSPIEYGRVQCYSGTMLFYRLLFADTNRQISNADNMVVILEDGHILPGYVKDGVLYGIEATAGGKAIVTYGPTKDIAGRISVYDAKQFLFAELFKWRIKKFEALQKQMEAYAKSTFGFKHNLQSPDKHAIQLSSAGNLVDPPPINKTPFGFGVSDSSPGDKARDHFDKSDKSQNFTKCIPSKKVICVESRPGDRGEKDYEVDGANKELSFKQLQKYFKSNYNVTFRCGKGDWFGDRRKSKMYKNCEGLVRLIYIEVSSLDQQYDNDYGDSMNRPAREAKYQARIRTSCSFPADFSRVTLGPEALHQDQSARS